MRYFLTKHSIESMKSGDSVELKPPKSVSTDPIEALKPNGWRLTPSGDEILVFWMSSAKAP